MGTEAQNPPSAAGRAALALTVNPIDRSLGSRLRDKRMASGLTPEQLAERLAIDPKDILSYEIGAKRISADRLLGIASVLGVRPAYFFGFRDEPDPPPDFNRKTPREEIASHRALSEQGLRLHRAFLRVKNDALRESIVALVVELAKGGGEGPLSVLKSTGEPRLAPEGARQSG